MGGQPWATDDDLARLRRSFTLADLAPLTAAAGVTETVVVQTVTEPWETPDLLALSAGRLPGRAMLAGVVGWTDLADPAITDSVAALRALPGGDFLCGIRHPLLTEPDPEWLVRPAVLRGLQALGRAGLCFDLVTLPAHWPAAVVAARSVPGLTFVLDHLGGPPIEPGQDSAGPWAAAIRDLAALPNVACKLSGMHTDPPDAADLRSCYETVLAAFGPDRLMFGSDWPVSTLAASYGQVCGLYRELTAQLSACEQDMIFDRTARRAYSLVPPTAGRRGALSGM